jgi:hypothetical protein
MIANPNPKDLGQEQEYFMAFNVLSLILPYPSPEDTDLVLVTSVMNRMLSLMENSTVPSSVLWGMPLILLLDWWEYHIHEWLDLSENSPENTTEKLQKAGVIQLLERQIRFVYSSHPVHQRSHPQEKAEIASGCFLAVLHLLKLKIRYVGESIILPH